MRWRRAKEKLRNVVPEGRSILESDWEARHNAILTLLWIHVFVLSVFGIYRGFGAIQSLGECSLLAASALAASWAKIGRSGRSAFASIGLITSSAILVQFSGGYIEAHFHFFVMLAVIAVYEDWYPYLIAIFFVAIEHGLTGQFIPTAIYNHPNAFAHPWKWAGIHAGFISAESIALLAAWRVSQRVRAQADLVLNCAGEGIVGLNLEKKITFANPAVAAMTGYSLESLVGGSIDRILGEADGSPTICIFDPSLSSETGFVCRCADKVLLRRDGIRVSVDLLCNPIREHGMIVGTVMAIRDETRRKIAEAALRENEARFRQVTENIAEVFWMTSVDKSQMIYISPAYEAIWGRSRQTLFERPTSWMDAIHPEDRDRVRSAALQKQVEGKYDEEYRIIRPDGSIRWIRDRAFPIRNEHQEVYRIVGVAAEITDHKEAEEAIRRANRELADLNSSLEERVKERTRELENMVYQIYNEKEKTDRIIHEIADGVIVTDTSGNIQVLNPAARRLLDGRPALSGPGSDVDRILHLRELFEDPAEPATKEIELLDPAMTGHRVLKTTAVPLKDEAGKLLGKVAVFHDITHFKEVDRLKSEFISNVSHELRTPLTSIKGYIDNLRDGIAGRLSEKQRDYLARMSKNSDHLVRLIGDLLDVSQIESGKISLHPTILSLQDLIAQVIDHLRPIAAEKQLELLFSRYMGGSRIRGDYSKLEQVVVNLLDNAIKFTPSGGRITVALEREESSIKTSIRDTGTLIPPEKRSKIFERFYRVDGELSSSQKGTGLGLYIAKNLIEMHGGKIGVNSEPRSGNEFYFVLPILS
ncbi:MAG TPA: PAS domain S-box protein [Nitrospiria bacterium]|nr:PAS domain S-box protein [Nitrospiria bacterium]